MRMHRAFACSASVGPPMSYRSARTRCLRISLPPRPRIRSSRHSAPNASSGSWPVIAGHANGGESTVWSWNRYRSQGRSTTWTPGRITHAQYSPDLHCRTARTCSPTSGSDLRRRRHGRTGRRLGYRPSSRTSEFGHRRSCGQKLRGWSGLRRAWLEPLNGAAQPNYPPRQRTIGQRHRSRTRLRASKRDVRVAVLWRFDEGGWQRVAKQESCGLDDELLRQVEPVSIAI